ncbi:hypothetical protein KIPE111705_03505 [Kibdelosporangium persicum]|uniref:Uncharacterized protein n=1 Tax=Kibdelosporangium persicum TaxID=2698649 RepID=A0ABX2F7S3_9PSEU|nr:hypothetical protein [Kibdelosporangium persicum]NRN67377.1 hypothetical protein [Kibdelosporangium persicum]
MNVVVLAAIITGSCAIVAGIIAGLMNLRSRHKPRQRVKMEDHYPTVAVTGESGSDSASSSNSQILGVQLHDIDVPDLSYALDHPVVDVKFVNTGGQPAYLTRLTVEIKWARSFRVLEDLLPYVDTSGPLMMPPSATYDVTLPDPARAQGERVTVGISQAIAGGETDRIHVRLCTKFEHSSTSVYSQPAATAVYILTLEFVHENGKRKLTSRPVAAACPGNILYIPTIDGLERNIKRFMVEVESLRARVDEEMERRNLPSVDWRSADDARASVPGDMDMLGRVNDNFWNPEKGIDDYLTRASVICEELVEALDPGMPDGLGDAVTLARETALRIPELRRSRV